MAKKEDLANLITTTLGDGNSGESQTREVSKSGSPGGKSQTREVSKSGSTGGKSQTREVSKSGSTGGKSQTREVSKSGSTGGKSQTREVSKSDSGPRYVNFIHKGARLTTEQINALDNLARDLSARRDHKDERITANTLIRVAVDYLVANGRHLTGDTEEDLRTSFMTSQH